MEEEHGIKEILRSLHPQRLKKENQFKSNEFISFNIKRIYTFTTCQNEQSHCRYYSNSKLSPPLDIKTRFKAKKGVHSKPWQYITMYELKSISNRNARRRNVHQEVVHPLRKGSIQMFIPCRNERKLLRDTNQLSELHYTSVSIQSFNPLLVFL